MPCKWKPANVSIQLVSPARGDLNLEGSEAFWYRVSIQLVSPARGDPLRRDGWHSPEICFHSTCFPCERGHTEQVVFGKIAIDGFPFNLFPLREGTPLLETKAPSLV